MGILNVTPDSFWESSRVMSVEAGIERALAMEADGADIIDIGGESSRPGSAYVDEAGRNAPGYTVNRRNTKASHRCRSR